MRIRIFRAPGVAEAMAQVRSALGLDALILSTVRTGDGVEVTAALDTEDEPGLPVAVPALPPAPGARTIDAPDGGDAAFRRHGLPPALAAAVLSAAAAASPEAACSRGFRFSRLPTDSGGAPLLLAGPPGAGKTLTVAKLATRLVMDGHRPMVITADDRRAGAVEQLAAFTRLLGLVLVVAGEPEQLRRALQRRDEADPVLIDMPALDPREADGERELAELIEAARPVAALVLPCGLDPAEAEEIALAHAAPGVRLMVPTRLDRSGRLGGVLAAARAASMALTEAGIGSGVADGLVRVTPALLAARLAPVPSIAPPSPPSASASPARLASPPAAVLAPETGGSALSLHIAAQSRAQRAGSGRTTP